mmetsp:Transcript_79414/g.229677  ORF Transcript_79414/g.229677 Transcript_79414/m.229677 type:complete len:218 (-) Transcript_79414:483-1136(-)
MPQTRSSKWRHVHSAMHSSDTTVDKPMKTCSNCGRASDKRISNSSFANSGACSKVTGMCRPRSSNSRSWPAESRATKRKPPKDAWKLAASTNSSLALSNRRTFLAVIASKLSRSSKVILSSKRPFQTVRERHKGKMSPLRKQTPINWPRNLSILLPGEPGETSSAGFNKKASRSCPISSLRLGLGTNRGSCADMSSSDTVSKKSRYTPPESHAGSSR